MDAVPNCAADDTMPDGPPGYFSMAGIEGDEAADEPGVDLETDADRELELDFGLDRLVPPALLLLALLFVPLLPTPPDAEDPLFCLTTRGG